MRQIPWLVKAIGVALCWYWLHVLFIEDGTLYSRSVGIWADYAMHTSLISFFIEQDLTTFFSQTPLLAGHNMPYPPLATICSAWLKVVSDSWYVALMIPALLNSLMGVLGLYIVAFMFTRERVPALMAVCLFLLCGGLGFVQLFTSPLPITEQFLKANFTHHLEQGHALSNVIIHLWLPQRSFLSSLPFTLLYMIAFYTIATGSNKIAWFITASLSTVLAALGQAHSVIVLVLFSFVILGLFWQTRGRQLLMSGALTGLCMLPWALFLSAYSSGDLNVRWSWQDLFMGQHQSAPVYFLLNWSPILVAVGYSYWRDRESVRLPFFIGLALFAVSHLVLFQQWPWTNSKVFVWAYYFWSIAISITGWQLWKAKGPAIRFVVIGAASLLMASGICDLIGVAVSRPLTMITPDLDQHAETLKQHTPKDAVVMTKEFLYSPVSLGGRTQLCAYEGWLWSYGLKYEEACHLRNTFFEQPNLSAGIEKFGITHFLGPEPLVLADSMLRYEKVVGLGHQALYKVSPPSGDGGQ